MSAGKSLSFSSSACGLSLPERSDLRYLFSFQFFLSAIVFAGGQLRGDP
jgi:hypothetical protein